MPVRVHRQAPPSEEDLLEFELEPASEMPDPCVPTVAADFVAARSSAQAEQQAREQRAAEIQAAKRKMVRRRRVRIGVAVAAVVAIGVAAIPLGFGVLDEARYAEAFRSRLDQAQQAAAQLGFVPEREWFDVGKERLTISVPRYSCSALVAVTEQGEAAPIALQRAQQDGLEANEGLVWCSCDAEQVTVSVVIPAESRVALRWLSASMPDVGGPDVLGTTPISGFTVIADAADRTCADQAFAVWASVPGRGAMAELKTDRAGIGRRLLAEGLAPMGVFTADKRFAVVRTEPDTCYLAVPEASGATLTLRNAKGEPLVNGTSNTIGWCVYTGTSFFSLWREQVGVADVVVVRAAADRVGGLTGLQELGSRHAGAVDLALDADKLSRDALAALRASNVLPNTIQVGDDTGLPAKLGQNVVAFAMRERGSFLPEVSPPVSIACSPNVAQHAPLRAYVCAQSREQQWQADGHDSEQGAAQGAYPFWLTVLSDTKNPESLRAVARMLAFARRMTLLGFEPTTSDGVKDTASGAILTGRPGKPENVAVGLTQQPPFIHPLTDGKPWTIDGDIHVIEVPEGKRRTVNAARSLGANAAARRVVVWRR